MSRNFEKLFIIYKTDVFYLNIIDIYCIFASEMRKMVDDIISIIMEIGSGQYHSAHIMALDRSY